MPMSDKVKVWLGKCELSCSWIVFEFSQLLVLFCRRLFLHFPTLGDTELPSWIRSQADNGCLLCLSKYEHLNYKNGSIIYVCMTNAVKFASIPPTNNRSSFQNSWHKTLTEMGDWFQVGFLKPPLSKSLIDSHFQNFCEISSAMSFFQTFRTFW